MGLAERRGAAAFEADVFPKLKAGLTGILGFDVPIECDWESLSSETAAYAAPDKYPDGWTKIYFAPLTMAFTSICQDDLGKEAIQGVLKKIVVQNKARCSSANSWSKLENGTLTLDHMWSNVDAIKDRAESTRKLIEKAADNLEERRTAKTFQTDKFPKLKADVLAAAGFDVPMEIDWKALSLVGSARLFDDSWPKIYFTPLIGALKAITADDMGKEALKGALKKVVITNTGNNSSPNSAIKFTSGTLSIDHLPTSNVGDIKGRQDGIQKILEKAL
jgi:hypothetical protein